MSEQMREKFESEWDSWGWANAPHGFWDAAKGSYADAAIQWAWQGYRRAALATQPQAPQGAVTQKWHAPGIGEVHHEDHKFIVYCSRITDDEEIVDDVLAIRICALLNAAPETPEGQKP